MKESKKKVFYDQIKDSKKIAIISHVNPDADAIGSAFALKRLIKQNLETENEKYLVDIFIDFDELDELYKPMIGTQKINEQRAKKYDLAIAVDCSSRERLGKYDKIFKKALDTLNLDHHETNDYFAKNNIVASKYSSTSELIYVLFIDIKKWNFSPDIYSLLYAGIVTDTNNLTQNLGLKTIDAIKEFTKRAMAEGVNLNQIRDHFFKNKTPEQIELLTRALNSIEFKLDGNVTTMQIDDVDFDITDTTQNDTLGIVDYAINLQNVKIGILFIKQNNGSYYVSLRSKDDIDVGKIAQEMGGGGHKNVAAFSTTPKQDLSKVKEKLLELCSQNLQNQKIETPLEDLFTEVSGEGPTDSDEEQEEQQNTSEKD